MITKVEQPKGNNAVDIGKLILAGLVLAAGIFAYSWFGRDGTIPASMRLLGVLAALVIALAIAAFTALGRRVRGFLAESQFEMRKVVWPTRDETIKTTGVIILVVIILSLLLGLIDPARRAAGAIGRAAGGEAANAHLAATAGARRGTSGDGSRRLRRPVQRLDRAPNAAAGEQSAPVAQRRHGAWRGQRYASATAAEFRNRHREQLLSRMDQRAAGQTFAGLGGSLCDAPQCAAVRLQRTAHAAAATGDHAQ